MAPPNLPEQTSALSPSSSPSPIQHTPSPSSLQAPKPTPASAVPPPEAPASTPSTLQQPLWPALSPAVPSFQSGTSSPSSSLQLGAPPSPPALVTYLCAPLCSLSSTKPLFTGFPKSGIARGSDCSQTKVYGIQRYFIGTRTRDIFKTASVHVPVTRKGNVVMPPSDGRMGLEYLKVCEVVYRIEKQFEPRRYRIVQEGKKEAVMEVVKGNKVWEVKNGSLFSSVAVDTVVAKVHVIESLRLLFTFVAVKSVLGEDVERLEMELGEGEGEFGRFDLVVGGRKIGGVGVGRFYLDMEVRDCSKEEAVLWICLVVAGELEGKTKLRALVSTE